MRAMTSDKKPIFLSYRQRGGISFATRIRAVLEAHFGINAVFQDNFSIKPGENWADRIQYELARSSIVLVLVHGDGWFKDYENISKYGVAQRLLFRESDWIRCEIRTALELQKTILPILSSAVSIWPRPSEADSALPIDITDLASRQTMTIDEQKFDETIPAVLSTIEKFVPARSLTVSKYGRPPHIEPELLSHMPLSRELVANACHLDAPYVGLKSFDTREAPIFFGREEDIKDLYENSILALGRAEVLLVYGPSGIGKSSIIYAGLVPRLEALGWQTRCIRRWGDGCGSQDLAELTENTHDTKQHGIIVFIDQVEEVFTCVGDQRQIDQLFDTVKRLAERSPNIRLVLSFRKDYLADVKEALKSRNIQFRWHLIKTMTREGLRRAISGVWNDERVARYFAVDCHVEADLEEALIERVSRDSEGNAAPLLQYQLRTLWDRSSSKLGSDVKLTYNTYFREEIDHSSLRSFVQMKKLPEVEALHPREARSGLVLDILFYYTSSQLTSASRTNEELIDRYSQIKALTLLKIKQSLVNAYLLSEDRSPNTTRLTHDSIAVVVWDLYHQSHAPGQRASALFAAKQRIATSGKPMDFSETDLEIIRQGLEGMAALPPTVRQIVDEEGARHDSVRRRRYELAIHAARTAHARLDLADVVEALQAAAGEEVNSNEVLKEALSTLYPALWLGERSISTALLSLVKQLASDKLELQQVVAAVRLELIDSSDRSSRLSLLAKLDPDIYNLMVLRYFPSMVYVREGEFAMGSLHGHSVERPVRRVKLGSFSLAKTPITFWQIALFCADCQKRLPNDGGFGRGERPVINISWYEAIEYCNWLSVQTNLQPAYSIAGPSVDLLSGSNGFRLPTEAEWEYAAREGGGECVFGNGKPIAKAGEMNFDASGESRHFWSGRNMHVEGVYEAGKLRGQTVPVATFSPNRLGLYDMSGNVWEWCWDWYDGRYYGYGSCDNPLGPAEGELRTIRGGSWSEPADGCRCTFRDKDLPIYHIQVVGFRVARSSTQQMWQSDEERMR